MKKLGRVKNLKINEYGKYILSMKPMERINKYWNPDTSIWGVDRSGYNRFKNVEGSQIDSEIKKAFYNAEFCCKDVSSNTFDRIRCMYNLFVENNVELPYVYRDEDVTVVNMSGNLFCVLNEYVEIEELTNVNELTGSQIKSLMGKVEPYETNNLPDTLNNVSINSLKSKVSDKLEELEQMKREHEKQIEEYRQELDAKLQELRNNLQAKRDELNAMKDKMLDELFILEDKIFDLRIILKEAFQVVNIKKGKRCETERPIIVYQKFRYLEDEIIRLTSLSAMNFMGQHKQIEKCIANTPILLETLCPTEKCITVCRVTDKNTYYVRNSQGGFDILELLHGKQLFILIRDGENVDGVWVDEDVVLGNNLFITEHTQLNSAQVVTEDTKIRSSAVTSMLSRKYLFLILQVCIEDKLINLPNETTIIENSPYIIFSDADRLIDANPYPNMQSYVSKLNEIENCKPGDIIMVVQSCTGSNYTYNGYRRDYTEYRGVGSNDRAHDAYVKQGLNKINCILAERWFDNDYKKYIYVSAEKSWSNSGARANVKLYSDEYINLTWISSNHIKYWIDSKKIAGFSTNSYAQLCEWLKECLIYIVNREKEEFELINKYVRFDYTPTNIDKLTDWKFTNKIRKIHSKNVRKFIQNFSE